jgi:Fe2+ transport system protein B
MENRSSSISGGRSSSGSEDHQKCEVDDEDTQQSEVQPPIGNKRHHHSGKHHRKKPLQENKLTGIIEKYIINQFWSIVWVTMMLFIMYLATLKSLHVDKILEKQSAAIHEALQLTRNLVQMNEQIRKLISTNIDECLIRWQE